MIIDNLSLFNGLHYVSLFGIDEIVASLVELEGCDINQKAALVISYTSHVSCLKWVRGSGENSTQTERRQPQRTRWVQPNTALAGCLEKV